MLGLNLLGRDFIGIEMEPEFIDIALVINTSDTKSSVDDGKKIRQNVLRFKIPYFTTIRAALTAATSLSTVQTGKTLEVKSLQEYLSER